jgi:hypothetical protein
MMPTCGSTEVPLPLAACRPSPDPLTIPKFVYRRAGRPVDPGRVARRSSRSCSTQRSRSRSLWTSRVIRERSNKRSKPYRDKFGHTPLSADEEIPRGGPHHLAVTRVVAVGHSGGGDVVVVGMINRHPSRLAGALLLGTRQTSATSTYPSAQGSSPRLVHRRPSPHDAQLLMLRYEQPSRATAKSVISQPAWRTGPFLLVTFDQDRWVDPSAVKAWTPIAETRVLLGVGHTPCSKTVPLPPNSPLTSPDGSARMRHERR